MLIINIIFSEGFGGSMIPVPVIKKLTHYFGKKSTSYRSVQLCVKSWHRLSAPCEFKEQEITVAWSKYSNLLTLVEKCSQCP